MENPTIVNKPDTYEPIEQFYSGKSVLITGGTGFLGKVLIEKLVYSCPNIRNVYVLVREKKNIEGRERFKTLLESELFTRLKEEKPECLKKIIPVIGCITLCDLGMAEEDKNEIFDKVSIVFHVAATVNFNQPLKQAMQINVEGTRNMVNLSRKIKNIQMFVYVSTAFSNTDKMFVEEIVYPPPMNIDDVYTILNEHSDVENHDLEILKDRPNAYTFTKALAESLVDESRGDIPTVIIRPSLVVAAVQDPVPGWIKSWASATPVLEMMARGWARCYYGKSDYAFDMIPVDYVINAMIVAAARNGSSKKTMVYNCCTSTINRISLQDGCELYCKESVKTGYNMLPLNSIKFIKSSVFIDLMTLIFQTIPAYFLDFILILSRKPRKYVKLLGKFANYQKTVRFFSSRDWFMISTRLRDLDEELDTTDREKFPCNPAQINWNEFMPIYFNGVVRFLIGAPGKAHAC